MDFLADSSFELIPIEQVVVGSRAALHAPEPTTTLLMSVGLFGILYAGRGRKRAT